MQSRAGRRARSRIRNGRHDRGDGDAYRRGRLPAGCHRREPARVARRRAHLDRVFQVTNVRDLDERHVTVAALDRGAAVVAKQPVRHRGDRGVSHPAARARRRRCSRSCKAGAEQSRDRCARRLSASSTGQSARPASRSKRVRDERSGARRLCRAHDGDLCARRMSSARPSTTGGRTPTFFPITYADRHADDRPGSSTSSRPPASP